MQNQSVNKSKKHNALLIKSKLKKISKYQETKISKNLTNSRIVKLKN